MLLRMSARNHKSLRDVAELDMVASSPDSTGRGWPDQVHPVAAVFGANASGKTTVLDALTYIRASVAHSATAWMDAPALAQPVFRMDPESRKSPSEYQIEFVVDDVRYEYGFVVHEGAYAQEWLFDYPKSRRRKLFSRNGDNEVEFGRAVRRAKLPGVWSPRELVLARAAVSEHAQLGPIGDALRHGIDLYPFDDAARSIRLADIARWLESGVLKPDTVATLLRVADVGISGVQLEACTVEPSVRRLRHMMVNYLREESGDPVQLELVFEDDETVTEMKFVHGGGDNVDHFSVADESSGTVAWLVLATSALNAMRDGRVFVVDELDSSLHPFLVSELVGMFTDPELNQLGAQIIFTTHDASLMRSDSKRPLHKEQVWFTEKDHEGATSLTCLADFSPRQGQNLAKRYLDGRYGAVPHTASSLLHDLLLDGQVS